MNLKTTLLLALLVVMGGGAWLLLSLRQPVEAQSPTLRFLEEELKPGSLVKVEVQRAQDAPFVLEKAGQEWSLPGKWPVRSQEVVAWLDVVTSLRSRFASEPVAPGEQRKTYPLVLNVTLTSGKTHTLHFAEHEEDANRFTRKTSLRLDEQPESVRLAPGLLTALARPQEYFQQRRLFPVERLAKEANAKEKIEQLVATEIEVKGPVSQFRVAKVGPDWQLQEPVKDRVESAKLKSALASIPDLWVERFVDRAGKKLDDFGLKEPHYVVAVTRPGGATVRLLIGNVSEVKTKRVLKPSPPGPFGQPPPPIAEEVREEYRYARLAENDQLFEVKAQKLDDIAVAVSELRDPFVARFKTEDVRRLEIKQPDQTLILVKDAGKWRFDAPTKDDAESGPVSELLDKLSGLQVRGEDVMDKVDPKTVGLEKPLAEIRLTLDDKRVLVFELGTKEKTPDKVFVRVDSSPRVNRLDGDVLKVVQRPALAYRNRRVLDLAAKDLSKMEVRRADETFTIEKRDGAWKLSSPVQAEVDAGKIEELVKELGTLEGNEFITETPKADELEKRFGLGKAALTVTLGYEGAKKPGQTLVIGKERAGKDDIYARVEGGPVFTIKKELRERLDRSSLSYRPLQVLKLAPGSITEIVVQKVDGQYQLKKDGGTWKLSGRFDAEPAPFDVEQLAEAFEQLRAERYEAHQGKDLASYGLDKPYLTLRIRPGDKEKPRELILGKTLEKGDRYAKVGDSEAVFVLGAKTTLAVDKDALDLLKKELLTVDAKEIARIKVAGQAPFTLEPKDGKWKVLDSPVAAFVADEPALTDTLGALRNLRATRYAAYGPMIDWKTFGLDKPVATATIEHALDADKKSKVDVLELGSPTGKEERYARVNKQDAVVVLARPDAVALHRGYLDYVDPLVLKYSFDAVTGLKRQMSGADLELQKDDDAWRMLKPAPRSADALTASELLDKTFRLRAARIAAYPVKDLAPFGLEKPAAVWTIQLSDDAGGGPHVIKVGALVKDEGKETGERYALTDAGQKVAVLPAELSRLLVAPVLFFADRNLASFGSADGATFERGPRKLTFSKAKGVWKVTEPVKADAEEGELDEFLKSLLRLRADEIVAEKGADLKKFGLDAPAAQWRFRAGDKEVLHLVIGAPEQAKEKEANPRRYARLGSGDQVFLLSPKLADRALAEYRNRKPWPALDAAQVESLRIVGPGKSFTLKKNEAGWNVEGEPDAKVNAKAVTDTLDALASLKVLTFVVDHQANLQLYGLQPPVWTLEVKTPAGPRTLHVGRGEGESQRHYAAIAGEGAVFVLSESDSARLLRPLSAFTTTAAGE